MSMSRSLLLALPLCAVTACSGFDSGDELGVAMPSTLRLELRNDNAGGGSGGASGLQEAIAVVHAAAAHVAGSGWHTIMEGHVEVDFLRLADSAADLGIANIPAGKVTQLRLYVLDDEDAYVSDASGDRHPLLTPSGSESGIKVKGLWSLGECQAGTLVLSTNGKKAIHIHGRGADDSYILRPVIRADGLETEDIEGCVPAGPGDGSDDGDVPGGPGASGEGTPGDDDGDGDAPGDGDVPGGDDGDGDEGGDCYDPETGLVGACDGSGDVGGDLGGTGEGNDPAGGDDDGSGDVDGSGTGSGDTGSGGTGDPDGSGTGTGDTGSGGTGDVDGSGTGTGDTGSGGTGDVDGSGTGSGDTGSGGGGGDSGGDTESDLCFDPEGGFFTCPG